LLSQNIKFGCKSNSKLRKQKSIITEQDDPFEEMNEEEKKGKG